MNLKETDKKLGEKTKVFCNDFRDYILKVSKNASYNGNKLKNFIKQKRNK